MWYLADAAFETLIKDLAERLHTRPDMIIGRMYRMARWASQRLKPGDPPGLVRGTPAALDRELGRGWTEALLAIGSAQAHPDGLLFPDCPMGISQAAEERAKAATRDGEKNSTCALPDVRSTVPSTRRPLTESARN